MVADQADLDRPTRSQERTDGRDGRIDQAISCDRRAAVRASTAIVFWGTLRRLAAAHQRACRSASMISEALMCRLFCSTMGLLPCGSNKARNGPQIAPRALLVYRPEQSRTCVRPRNPRTTSAPRAVGTPPRRARSATVFIVLQREKKSLKRSKRCWRNLGVCVGCEHNIEELASSSSINGSVRREPP